MKWTNAKKWLPKQSCDVLVRHQLNGRSWYEVAKYSAVGKRFVDSSGDLVDKKTITHWAVIDDPKAAKFHPDKEPVVQQFHMYLISPSKLNENLNWLLTKKKLEDTLTVADMKHVLQNSYKDYDVVL